jgi:trk system potassium uptake protein TrkA
MEEKYMRVVILGCGRVGSMLATAMSREGHDVTIIDLNPDSFRRLGDTFEGKTVIGSGVDEDVLRRAGIESADAFVAVTNGDNRNIMSTQIAKEKFQVPKTVARINDPIRAAVYNEIGITTFCVARIGAGIIQDHLMNKPFKTVEDYSELQLEMGE